MSGIQDPTSGGDAPLGAVLFAMISGSSSLVNAVVSFISFIWSSGRELLSGAYASVMYLLKTREQATKQSKETEAATFFVRATKTRFVVSALEEGLMVSSEIGVALALALVLAWFTR
jgi:hypothetical protein